MNRKLLFNPSCVIPVDTIPLDEKGETCFVCETKVSEQSVSILLPCSHKMCHSCRFRQIHQDAIIQKKTISKCIKCTQKIIAWTNESGAVEAMSCVAIRLQFEFRNYFDLIFSAIKYTLSESNVIGLTSNHNMNAIPDHILQLNLEKEFKLSLKLIKNHKETASKIQQYIVRRASTKTDNNNNKNSTQDESTNEMITFSSKVAMEYIAETWDAHLANQSNVAATETQQNLSALLHYKTMAALSNSPITNRNVHTNFMSNLISRKRKPLPQISENESNKKVSM